MRVMSRLVQGGGKQWPEECRVGETHLEGICPMTYPHVHAVVI